MRLETIMNAVNSDDVSRRAFLTTLLAAVIDTTIAYQLLSKERDVEKDIREDPRLQRFYYSPDLDQVNILNGEYALVVEKKTQMMDVYMKSSVGWLYERSYPVSTAKIHGDKKKKGDGKTPAGIFTIYSIEESSTWRDPWDHELAYGPYFMRLQGDWDKKGRYHSRWRSPIGIHGTNQPDKIGTRASHGCIQMLNEDLLEVKERYTKVGTYVVIREELDRTINHYYVDASFDPVDAKQDAIRLAANQQRYMAPHLLPAKVKKPEDPMTLFEFFENSFKSLVFNYHKLRIWQKQ